MQRGSITFATSGTRLQRRARDSARRWCLLLGVAAMLAAPAAWAEGPSIGYAPAPDADATPDGLDAGRSYEVEFGAASPTGCNATSCAMTLTPVCGAGCTSVSDLTSDVCQIQMRSGNATITIDPGGFLFQGLSAQTMTLTCAPGAQNSVAQLSCSEKRGGNGSQVHNVWDVYCPSSAQAEFDSTPAGASAFNFSVNAGASSTQGLLVRNLGQPGSSLVVDASGLSGVISISPAPEQSIAQGGSVTYTIACAPTTAGQSVSQTLLLESNDGDEGAVTFPVTCAAPAAPVPEYASTPAAPGPIGITTNRPADGTANLNVQNIGNANLGISSLTGLAAPLSIAPAAQTIGAGGNQNFTVSCAGTNAGSYSGFVSVHSNDADESSVDYQVNCTVTAPEYDSAPVPGAGIALAATQGNNQSATLTLKNLLPAANGNLTISSIGGLSPPLSVIAPPTPFNVAAGGQTGVTVGCDAASVVSVGQTLTVTTNDADEPVLTYPVSCDVTSVGAPKFSSSLPSASPITLATSQGNNTSRTLTVQNVGSAALTLNIGNPTGPKISLAPNASGGQITLGQNQSQVFTVGCNASTGGTFTDAFVLNTNDPTVGSGGAVTFNVSCQVTSVAPEFTSSPPAPAAFSIATNQGANGTATFSVRNDGSATLNIGSITGATAPISVAPPSAGIASGNSQVFTVTCDATSAGTFQRGFTVNTNDSDEAAVAYTVSCLVNRRLPSFSSTPAASSTFTLSANIGASSTAGLSISNVAGAGPADLTLAASGLSAPSSIDLGNATLAVGAQQNHTITCSPTLGGQVSEQLQLATNDPAHNPVSYTVKCTGIAPRFGSYPAQGSFVSLLVTQGAGTSFALRVVNNGGAPLNVSPSGLSGALSVAPGFISIPAGGFQDYSIDCSASLSGTVQQTLTLATNDPAANPASYGVQCSQYVRPDVALAVRAILAARNLPLPDPVFKNGFE